MPDDRLSPGRLHASAGERRHRDREQEGAAEREEDTTVIAAGGGARDHSGDMLYGSGHEAEETEREGDGRPGDAPDAGKDERGRDSHVDPGALGFVHRQRADQRGELSTLVERLASGGHLGEGYASAVAVAALQALLSFETFEQLRREHGLDVDEVTAVIDDLASALLRRGGPD